MITELNLPFSTVKEANITTEELMELLSYPEKMKRKDSEEKGKI